MINRIKDYWDNPIEDRHEIRHLYAKRGRLLGMIFSSKNKVACEYYLFHIVIDFILLFRQVWRGE